MSDLIGAGGKDALVEVHDIRKWFPVQTGLTAMFNRHIDHIRAVDGVSFTIRRGEVFGLAGESGSGKTTIGRCVIGMEKPSGGTIRFDEIDLGSLSGEEMRRLRRRMQIIYQDPLASLNPRMTIGDAIIQGLKIHYADRKKEHRDLVIDMIQRVGLTPPEFFFKKYPHQISGGQRQRVVIARALITRPELILADEPIAMADVSVRALLLDLMVQLKETFHLTYLFITHDLATAKYICDRIGVLYLGKLVEVGNLREVYAHPLHPYTQALLAAVPEPNPSRRRTMPMPAGEIPNPINPPSGCRFHPRCPFAAERCDQEEPKLREFHRGHWGACHYAEHFLS